MSKTTVTNAELETLKMFRNTINVHSLSEDSMVHTLSLLRSKFIERVNKVTKDNPHFPNVGFTPTYEYKITPSGEFALDYMDHKARFYRKIYSTLSRANSDGKAEIIKQVSNDLRDEMTSPNEQLDLSLEYDAITTGIEGLSKCKYKGDFSKVFREQIKLVLDNDYISCFSGKLTDTDTATVSHLTVYITSCTDVKKVVKFIEECNKLPNVTIDLRIELYNSFKTLSLGIKYLNTTNVTRNEMSPESTSISPILPSPKAIGSKIWGRITIPGNKRPSTRDSYIPPLACTESSPRPAVIMDSGIKGLCTHEFTEWSPINQTNQISERRCLHCKKVEEKRADNS